MNKISINNRRVLIILALTSLFSVVFYQSYFNGHQLENMIIKVTRTNKAFPACLLPKLDPFHKQALDEIQDLEPLDCGKKDLATIVNGILNINVNHITYINLQYIQRPEDDDFNVDFSNHLLLTDFKKISIQKGKIGCLVTNNNNILQFDSDHHVIKTDICLPQGFFEMNDDGRIINLDEKCLGVEDNCVERCPLLLKYECDEDDTKFLFESNGIIRHSKSGACVMMTSDDFGDYTELILSRDCQKKSSRWHMQHFYDRDVKIELPVLEDFIKLVFIKDKEIYVEYHASVSPKNDKMEAIINAENKYNILLIVLESQSTANVIRKMPETYKYLKEDKNTILFHGHTIVGDGTTDQLCAILAGQLEKYLPETRRNFEESGYVDEWPMIFRNFSNSRYVSLFSEDSYDFAAFNYRLNGFKKPPTDHYSRIFWKISQQKDDDWRCIGSKAYHRINLDYTLSFFNSYKNRPKIALTMLSTISHNNMNNIQHVDKDLLTFLKDMKYKGFLKDSFVFILGDHGLRTSSFRSTVEGSLEERLPFMSLTIPDKFQNKHRDVMKIAYMNSEILTSHFDIHATLFHILNFPRDNNNEIGQSLLTLIDGNTRTCQSAGVEDHWCPCIKYNEISTKDDVIVYMGKQVVKYINRLKNSTTDSQMKCAELNLINITYAAVNKHKLEKFKSIENNEDHYIDISDEDFDFKDKKPKLYRLILTVNPSGGIYEVSIYKDNNNHIKIDPNLSRLNLYGDQPKCIAKKYPHLRKFCFCNNFSQI